MPGTAVEPEEGSKPRPCGVCSCEAWLPLKRCSKPKATFTAICGEQYLRRLQVAVTMAGSMECNTSSASSNVWAMSRMTSSGKPPHA
eukprot:CAMPEP_0169318044 /NCGR_PEP_ID=MMETSP1017-20121227/7067_1 /TAXON_ID=342587 /ORGANISM="Karlodinium micrum, Strain CCMP2283" /LENGTH=86 /DNA_ID=CAMNT_0009412275 /DNA_START=63 /DNA_END=324 /DNA_ORIENTATION=+